MNVCLEKQHSFRNAVQCLEGWICELRKQGKIDGQDRDIAMLYLKRLVVCSKLDECVNKEQEVTP